MTGALVTRAVIAAALACFLTLPAAARGEGSVNVNSGAGTLNRHYFASSNTDAFFTAIYVYADAGERIDMGSSAMGTGSASILLYPPNTSFARTTDPTRFQRLPATSAELAADPVYRQYLVACSGTVGRISTRAQEVAGPLPNPGGYTPCSYTVTTPGIYAVAIISQQPNAPGNQDSALSTIANPNVGNQLDDISMWDVTVRGTDGTSRPGRVFTTKLGQKSGNTINNPAAQAQFNAYIHTRTGFDYQLTFFDHAGIYWWLVADDSGVVDSATGRRTFASFNYSDGTRAFTDARLRSYSWTAPALDPRHLISFNPIDPVVFSGAGGLGPSTGYATAPVTPATNPIADPVFVGQGALGGVGTTSQGAGGAFRFTSVPGLDGLSYFVAIDFDGNGVYGDPSDVRIGPNEMAASGNLAAWDGLNGTGAAPACGTYAYRLDAALSEVHFTQDDVENSRSGTQLRRLTMPGDPTLGNPLAVSYDDIDPYKAVPITNTVPSSAFEQSSGPGFHAWSAGSGDRDYVDGWTRLPGLSLTGTLQVNCPPPPPVPKYDLAIDKDPERLLVTVGDPITYTLTVRNLGPDTASAPVVLDRLPDQLQMVSTTTESGTCTTSGNDARCELDPLQVGEPVRVEVTARAVAAGVARNVTIVESSTIELPPGKPLPPPAEPPPPRVDPQANNIAAATVAAVPARLTLAKATSHRVARPGAPITFRLTVRNPSRETARDVLICDRLPSLLRHVRGGRRARAATRLYCWPRQDLAAGASRTYRLIARPRRPAGGHTTLRNSAIALASNAQPRLARTRVSVQAPPPGVTG